MTTAFNLTRRSFFVMPIALAACKKGWSVLEMSGLTMGTSYNIVAVDHTRSVDKTQLQAAIDDSLALVNRQMSNWDSGSEISIFNAATTPGSMKVSADLAHVMEAAAEVNAATGGSFDVTVGPLIDLWGFGSGHVRGDMPSDAEIAQALACCGQSDALRVEGQRLHKMRPEAEVYLSAIGKGYGVDRVARVMAEHGIKDYMVEIGGDLYTAGTNPDGHAWRVGIETPQSHDRGVQQVVGVSDMGMATSGDYRNFFDYEGKRYSHIIDATTGRPVTHSTASVTVMTENAMMADAWATALLVLGTERGLQIANDRDMAVLFIDRTGQSGDKGFATTASDRFGALAV